jgi:hypothetical protein
VSSARAVRGVCIRGRFEQRNISDPEARDGYAKRSMARVKIALTRPFQRAVDNRATSLAGLPAVGALAVLTVLRR